MKMFTLDSSCEGILTGHERPSRVFNYRVTESSFFHMATLINEERRRKKLVRSWLVDVLVSQKSLQHRGEARVRESHRKVGRKI